MLINIRRWLLQCRKMRAVGCQLNIRYGSFSSYYFPLQKYSRTHTMWCTDANFDWLFKCWRVCRRLLQVQGVSLACSFFLAQWHTFAALHFTFMYRMNKYKFHLKTFNTFVYLNERENDAPSGWLGNFRSYCVLVVVWEEGMSGGN